RNTGTKRLGVGSLQVRVVAVETADHSLSHRKNLAFNQLQLHLHPGARLSVSSESKQANLNCLSSAIPGRSLNACKNFCRPYIHRLRQSLNFTVRIRV